VQPSQLNFHFKATWNKRPDLLRAGQLRENEMQSEPKLNTHLSAETLYQILDELPTPIYVKDDQLRFIFSNKKHCELAGRSSTELIGLSDREIFPPELSDGFVQDDLDVMNSDTALIKEERVRHADGVHRHVLSRKAKLLADGNRALLIGTNSDLTAVKKREEQYFALAQTVPVGVMQVEETGNITYFNPLMQSYLNTDVHAMNAADLCGILGRSNEEFPGVASNFECSFKSYDGSIRRFLIISSGWSILGKGTNRAAIVSMVDVSENVELKRINEEILRLNNELASNVRLLKEAQDALIKKGRLEQMGQLTATIAHELRNPLGAVRTSAFVMERRLKNSGLDLDAQFNRIKNGVTRCDNIIAQLLDFSRGKQLDCKLLNLDDWLTKIVEEEAARLPTNVNIKCMLGLGGLHVSFDPGRLQRAILNLIANASEAMVGIDGLAVKPDAPEATITLLTGLDGPFVTIKVSDNGPGMNAEVVGRIREPLFTTKSFGTGLGVPVIEQVAAQHGGSLTIESVLGEGSSFTLRLPVYEAAALQISA
jgi:PAS domain S-box-containing protein